MNSNLVLFILFIIAFIISLYIKYINNKSLYQKYFNIIDTSKKLIKNDRITGEQISYVPYIYNEIQQKSINNNLSNIITGYDNGSFLFTITNYYRVLLIFSDLVSIKNIYIKYTREIDQDKQYIITIEKNLFDSINYSPNIIVLSPDEIQLDLSYVNTFDNINTLVLNFPKDLYDKIIDNNDFGIDKLSIKYKPSVLPINPIVRIYDPDDFSVSRNDVFNCDNSIDKVFRIGNNYCNSWNPIINTSKTLMFFDFLNLIKVYNIIITINNTESQLIDVIPVINIDIFDNNFKPIKYNGKLLSDINSPQSLTLLDVNYISGIYLRFTPKKIGGYINIIKVEFLS